MSRFPTAFVAKCAEAVARAIYYRIFRLLVRVRCWAYLILDQIAPGPSRNVPPPNPFLRFKIGGTPSLSKFLETGRKCCQSLVEAMQKTERPLCSPDMANVLDFGCGCARTLCWVADQFPEKNYYGTDVDAEMIAWCRKNVHFAKFSLNNPLPPSPYRSRMFDLIYAISVFTHLDEPTQLRWLAEFRRLLRPEGMLFLTVHGEAVWSNLPVWQKDEIRRRGVLTTYSSKLRGFFPDWYQTSFHTEKYVRTTYSKCFMDLRYLPEAMGYLDVVICQGALTHQDSN